MPPLSLMIKPVSGLCNMQCGYCFYRDEMARRVTPLHEPKTAQTLEKLVRRAVLHAEGELQLIFQVGEPMLAGKEYFLHLLALEKKYRRANLTIRHSIQTNGLTLDAQWCVVFREGQFLVGISLDGPEVLHDENRRDRVGLPTWQRVRAGVELLRREGIPYNILCVVTETMTIRAKDVFETLQEHAFLQFIPCMDGGEGTSFLTSRGYGQFLIDLFDCYEQACRKGKPVSIRTFDNWLAMAIGHVPESCTMSGRCTCASLIEADGSVYPCDFYAVDAWRLGNVNQMSFARLEATERARQFVQPQPLPAQCRDCSWLLLCRGGCRRDRDAHPESQDGRSRWCEGLKLFFEQRGYRLHQLARSIYSA